eukprot:TRINITY_DN252_c0_g1_i1.p1 TRINITY_DN252_c0_g1~~TRINITY_DN252_c0_g1_i1.p1  ORF type:complete len:1046 (+),score=230.04 TRINITY_DN252_c0_g1_i1:252-3140(+)
MAPGAAWFVVSAAWFHAWAAYVHLKQGGLVQGASATSPRAKKENRTGTDVKKEVRKRMFSGERPGIIDNNDIIDDRLVLMRYGPQLRPNLQCNVDYYVIPEKAWLYLRAWYGGGPEIKRTVIEEGIMKQRRVEVYKLVVKAKNTNLQGAISDLSETTVIVSKKDTVGKFKQHVCSLMGLPPDHVRVWSLSPRKLLKNESKTMERICVMDCQQFLMERQVQGKFRREEGVGGASGVMKSVVKTLLFLPSAPDELPPRFGAGSVPFGSSGSGGLSFGGVSHFTHADLELKGEPPHTGKYTPGLCGLRNLGNTCFMNSALQCLCNTPPLVEYFLDNGYRSDLNTRNPLGMKGQVAERFATLVRFMWSGSFTVLAPVDLKWVIGKYAPQFSNYGQHDAQELLSFLLDGLHEDLNQITKKPYVEAVEARGRPDGVVAEEAWKAHLLRNMSVIVDLFQGQLKSTLVCPDCKTKSVTFDPFMYLSLPLPVSRERFFSAAILRCGKNAKYFPIKYCVKVSKQGTIWHAKEALAKLAGLQAEDLTLASVGGSRIVNYLPDKYALSMVGENEAVLGYEIPSDDINENSIKVQVMFRAPVTAACTEQQKRPAKPPFVLTGIPLLFLAKRGATAKWLYRAVWFRIRKCLFTLKSGRPPSPEHFAYSDDDCDCAESGRSESVAEEEGGAATSHETSGREGEASSENSKERSGDSKEELLEECPYPFCLAVVNSGGTYCACCSGGACWGCRLDYAARRLPVGAKAPTLFVAVEWDASVSTTSKAVENCKMLQTDESCQQSAGQKEARVTLNDCLKLFTTNEQLGPKDPWFCPMCKTHKQAYKKFDLWKLPEVLVIHLKRFCFNHAIHEKIGVDVQFPVRKLDLTGVVPPRDGPPSVYKLYAVSNHSGGLGGGHYTAKCVNAKEHRWYDYNDSSVSPVSTDSLQSPAAYLLFYRRKHHHTRVRRKISCCQIGNSERT